MPNGIYISGPMRGHREFNFPAFDRAELMLVQSRDCPVFSPAQYDRQLGFDPTDMLGTDEELAAAGHDLRAAFQRDCDWICQHASCIYMLPGWSRSTGATAERALGLALGLHIEGAPY